jgi:hypothetical protein
VEALDILAFAVDDHADEYCNHGCRGDCESCIMNAGNGYKRSKFQQFVTSSLIFKRERIQTETEES